MPELVGMAGRQTLLPACHINYFTFSKKVLTYIYYKGMMVELST